MGIPLCVICCFSLAAFNICSLIFVNLINMCLGVFRLGFILFGTLCVYPIWNSLCFLDLGDSVLPHFREVFNYYLKYFLMVFLFVFFFWDSYNSNVGVFHIPLFYYLLPPECFRSHLLHYSLYFDSFLFLLGPC